MFRWTTIVNSLSKVADHPMSSPCWVVKNPIFQIQRFLRVGPTLGGGVEPGRADVAWPSPRPAQRVIFSKSLVKARPGLGDSNPM